MATAVGEGNLDRQRTVESGPGLAVGLSGLRIAAIIESMTAAGLPDGVMDRILEVLQPEEVWLFGSRARETHRPDSDWDLLAVLPDTAGDDRLDLGTLWPRLRDLRRLRVDVFEHDRRIFGELSEAVAREGRLVHGR
jgi:predicted nucleotidyltransferase